MPNPNTDPDRTPGVHLDERLEGAAPDDGREGRTMREPDDDRAPGGGGQKVAGVPRESQGETNTPSERRPDTPGVVRERGGAFKGDPEVGGTRPD